MNKLPKPYIAFVALAIIFLAFVAGYSVRDGLLLQGSAFHNSIKAAKALTFVLSGKQDSYRWHKANKKTRTGDVNGIITLDVTQASPGYTLFTNGFTTTASLIDIEGNEVWNWSLPFDQVWPDPTHLSAVAALDTIFWRKAELFPNGDLLVIYDGEGVTPSGHGLAKIDKDSNLIWKFSDSAHHDVQLDEAGNIYVLTYKFRTEPLGGSRTMFPPMLVDDIVVLDQDGNEQNRINVVEAIADSEWGMALNLAVPNEKGDYFHTNSVHPISAESARHLDFAEPGDILISLREFSAIFIIDPQTGLTKWSMRGPWVGQHDAEVLPNGNMLIFDNKGHLVRKEGTTRIIEFNPYTHEIIWQYAGTDEIPLSTRIRGAQQRLPNGNTLITESAQARLVEVTADNEIVWDFMNPTRIDADNKLTPVVMWGQRYSPDFAEFLAE